MATIAELLVKITAKDAGLRRGLRKAKNQVAKFAKAIKKKLLILVGAAVAFAAALATVKIANMIKRTAKEIDVLAKTSKKLGITVEKLQELQFAARLSGVSVETFNMAIQRMVRRVAEAGLGTGEAVNALKELGLNAKELSRLSPDQQFLKISRAMRAIGNQGDKVRLAMKLFDSEGVALVNTLGLNLEKVSAEFRSLGIAISSQQAKAVEAFNDSSLKLSVIWEGLLKQVTAGVAPALQSLVDKVVQFIKEAGGVGPVAQRMASAVISGVSGMIKAFSILINVLNVLIGTFNRFVAAAQGVKVVAQSVAILSKKLNPFASKKDVEEKERNLGETFASISKGSSVLPTIDTEAITAGLLKLSQSLDKQATIISEVSKPSVKKSMSGFGSITDATGRRLEIGKPQKVEVTVTADKEGIINAVVTNQSFKDSVVQQVNTATNDAARATRR